MSHRKALPGGVGRNANRGIGGGRQQRFEDALQSVPRLQFDQTGECVLENVTRQQLTGLKALAARADRKTGKSPVWTVFCAGPGHDAVIHHNRYRQRYEDRQDYQRSQEIIGRLNFRKGMATVKPNAEEREALRIVANRLGWTLNEQGETVYVAKAS